MHFIDDFRSFAGMLFWSNRLDFVAEVEVVLSTFNQKRKEEARSDTWNEVIRLLENDIDELKERRIIWDAVRFIVACVIILLWIIVGLLTFGWLWPRQIREWLFKVQVTSLDKENSAEQIRFKEMKALREELSFLQEEIKASNTKEKSDLCTLKDIANASQTHIQTEMNDIKAILNDMFEVLEESQ